MPGGSAVRRFFGHGPPRSVGNDPACPRGCSGHGTDRLLTSASVITVVRTVACVVLALAGLVGHDLSLLLAGLAAYWIGDVVDGAVARWRDEETITGAVLDICADRLCVAVVYLGFLVARPEFAIALGVYLVEFMLVDMALSLIFLRWPIASPNYFDRVDRLVWRLNWWPPAKALNSVLVAVLCVALDSPTLALAVAVGLLLLKSACLVRATNAVGRQGHACPVHDTLDG